MLTDEKKVRKRKNRKREAILNSVFDDFIDIEKESSLANATKNTPLQKPINKVVNTVNIEKELPLTSVAKSTLLQKPKNKVVNTVNTEKKEDNEDNKDEKLLRILKMAKNLRNIELKFLLALIEDGEKAGLSENVLTSRLDIFKKHGLPHNQINGARKGLEEKGLLSFEWKNDPNHPKKSKRFFYTLHL